MAEQGQRWEGEYECTPICQKRQSQVKLALRLAVEDDILRLDSSASRIGGRPIGLKEQRV